MKSRPVILVTGASRGLGRGVAEELARSGMSVGIHYAFNEPAAVETAKACRSLAGNSLQIFPLIRADLSKKEERDGILAELLAQAGRVDGLVNNAGIAPKIRSDLTDATEEIYDEVMAVNLKAPYFLSQQFVRHCLAHPGGSLLTGGYKLVFVTSLSANTASINRGEYCISKAGLSMAAQLWATRLAADHIQVVEFRPGIMETDMTSGVKEKYEKLIKEGLVPLKRWGKPSDLGIAVRSFLEGGIPFSTGDIINIDGGFHLRRL